MITANSMKTPDKEREPMSGNEKPRKRAGHLTSREKIRGRDAEAARLRSIGYSYPQIAAKTGYASPSGAYKAVQRVMDRNAWEPVEEARLLELARLDQLFRAAWHLMRTAKSDAMQLQAVKNILMIMERRAKYLGLDAPAKSERTTIVRREDPVSPITTDDLDQEIRRLTAEVEGLDPQQDEKGRDHGGTSVSDPGELEEARRAAGL